MWVSRVLGEYLSRSAVFMFFSAGGLWNNFEECLSRSLSFKMNVDQFLANPRFRSAPSLSHGDISQSPE